jgi:hypothetical protein
VWGVAWLPFYWQGRGRFDSKTAAAYAMLGLA